jgi:tetratricopeptide (TPR) repeat protein
VSTKTLVLKSTLFRLILLLPAIFLLVSAFYVAKWIFGDAIAVQATNKELAEASVLMAPNDPQTYYSLAVLQENSFLPEDEEKALQNYELAAVHSPHDYRLWLTLGRVRERRGDSQGAEKAVRKAIELAPHYAQNRWTLGNLLLRQDRVEEAFAELRKAVESKPEFAPHVVNLAWQTFDGNIEQIKQHLGDTTVINAAFAPFLAKQEKFDEAAQAWNRLNDSEKSTTHKATGEELINSLIAAKKFRAAEQIQQQINSDETKKALPEKFLNSGFEIATVNKGPFDWQIVDSTPPQLVFDETQKQEGGRSLVAVFNANANAAFPQMSQIIVVMPDTRYRLDFHVKTNDLKSTAAIKWEIVDAVEGNVLAATAAVPTGTNDWQKISTDFTTGGKTEGIIVRLARGACPTSSCPFNGKIWFDNFTLQKN